MRAKFLIDIDEAMNTVSTTLKFEPSLMHPYVDSVDPILTNDLTLTDEPTCIASRTDIALPAHILLKTLRVCPSLATFRTLSPDAKLAKSKTLRLDASRTNP
jgi:hypothetical protein